MRHLLVFCCRSGNTHGTHSSHRRAGSGIVMYIGLCCGPGKLSATFSIHYTKMRQEFAFNEWKQVTNDVISKLFLSPRPFCRRKEAAILFGRRIRVNHSFFFLAPSSSPEEVRLVLLFLLFKLAAPVRIGSGVSGTVPLATMLSAPFKADPALISLSTLSCLASRDIDEFESDISLMIELHFRRFLSSSV